MKLSEFLKTIPEETLVQVFNGYWEFEHEATAKVLMEAIKNEKIFDIQWRMNVHVFIQDI